MESLSEDARHFGKAVHIIFFYAVILLYYKTISGKQRLQTVTKILMQVTAMTFQALI